MSKSEPWQGVYEVGENRLRQNLKKTAKAKCGKVQRQSRGHREAIEEKSPRGFPRRWFMVEEWACLRTQFFKESREDLQIRACLHSTLFPLELQ